MLTAQNAAVYKELIYLRKSRGKVNRIILKFDMVTTPPEVSVREQNKNSLPFPSNLPARTQ